MLRTITVKGNGKVTVVPDYVIIYISIDTQAKNYDDTIKHASLKIEDLNDSLKKIGFEKKAVKTVSFNVETDYKSVKDKYGNYKRVFNGYICNHRLKVEFDIDNKRIEQTLRSISSCLAKPDISISFTVKDPSAVNKELLKSAAVNARLRRVEPCMP